MDADVRKTVEIIISGVNNSGPAFSQLQKSLGSIDGQLRAVGGTMATAGAAIAGALAGIVTASVSLGDHLEELHLQTGLTVEFLRQLDYIASQNGTTLEAVAGSLRFLARSAAESRDETSPAAEAFGQLGIKALDANKEIRPLEPLLLDTLDGLSKVKNEGERTTLMLNILGRGATDARGVFSLTREEFKNTADEASRLAPITKDQAEKSDDLKDAIDGLGKSLSSLAMTISSPVMPEMEKLVKKIQEATVGARKWLAEHPRMAEGLAKISVALVGLGTGLVILGSLQKILPLLAAGFTMVTGPVAIWVSSITAVSVAARAAVEWIGRLRAEQEKEVGAKPLHGTTAPPGTYGIGAPGSSAEGMEQLPEITWLPKGGAAAPKPVKSITEQIADVQKLIDAAKGPGEPKKLQEYLLRLQDKERHSLMPIHITSPITEETWTGDKVIPMGPLPGFPSGPNAWTSWSAQAGAIGGLSRGSASLVGQNLHPFEALGGVAQESVKALSSLTGVAGDFGRTLVLGGNSVRAFGNALLNVISNLVGGLLERGVGGLVGSLLSTLGIVGAPISILSGAGGGGVNISPGDLVASLAPASGRQGSGGIRVSAAGPGPAVGTIVINTQAFAGDRAQAMAFADMMAKATSERTTGWRR